MLATLRALQADDTNHIAHNISGRLGVEVQYDGRTQSHGIRVVTYVISYYLFTFRGSVQTYKIHMDIEIVLFA